MRTADRPNPGSSRLSGFRMLCSLVNLHVIMNIPACLQLGLTFSVTTLTRQQHYCLAWKIGDEVVSIGELLQTRLWNDGHNWNSGGTREKDSFWIALQKVVIVLTMQKKPSERHLLLDVLLVCLLCSNREMSTSQKCGYALRLGRKGWFHLWISVWVAGKTVWSLVNTCHPERFRDEFLMIKRYTNLSYFTDF